MDLCVCCLFVKKRHSLLGHYFGRVHRANPNRVGRLPSHQPLAPLLQQRRSLLEGVAACDRQLCPVPVKRQTRDAGRIARKYIPSRRPLLKDGQAFLGRGVPDADRAVRSAGGEGSVPTRGAKGLAVQRVDADGVHRVAQLVERVRLTVAAERKRLFLLRARDVLHADTAFDAPHDVPVPL